MIHHILAQAHVYSHNRRKWRQGLNNKIMDRFQTKITEWERSLKNQSVSSVEINEQFSSLSKVITELSNQALLARILIPICRA